MNIQRHPCNFLETSTEVGCLCLHCAWWLVSNNSYDMKFIQWVVKNNMLQRDQNDIRDFKKKSGD